MRLHLAKRRESEGPQRRQHNPRRVKPGGAILNFKPGPPTAAKSESRGSQGQGLKDQSIKNSSTQSKQPPRRPSPILQQVTSTQLLQQGTTSRPIKINNSSMKILAMKRSSIPLDPTTLHPAQQES